MLSKLFWETIFKALFSRTELGVVDVASAFFVVEELGVSEHVVDVVFTDDKVFTVEFITDDVNIAEVIEVGIFTAAILTVFGEPFKLLALELSLADRLEKDESSEWQGDVEVLGTSTLIFALPGYN